MRGAGETGVQGSQTDECVDIDRRFQRNETDLQKATLQRLKPHVQRKPLEFSRSAAQRQSHQPSAAPVSGNESPPGLQPWPRGRPFMDDHFISKQSAERLQTKDAQSPKVTLPRQPWRQIGRLEQRIIPEIETLKHSAQLALVQIPSRHTLPLPVNCWLKVQLKTISMFKCCDPSRETSYLMNSSTWQALRVPVN